MIAYWGFRIASFLARRSPLRVAYMFGRAAGLGAYYAWPGGRRRCVQNMLHVTAGDEGAAKRNARASFANYGAYLIDFLRFEALDLHEVRRRVVFDDWDAIEAQRQGNGILFVTIHFGNWDLGAAALVDAGYPTSVIADRFDDPRLNELVLSSRRTLGMEIVAADRMGPGILRALRRNDVVAVLGDVPDRRSFVEVEFFGGTIAVTDGPARIALRTGASVIAATIPRLGRWSDRVTGELEPVEFTASGNAAEDIRGLTQATFRCFERMIHRHPDQWYIFRNLWVSEMAEGAPAVERAG